MDSWQISNYDGFQKKFKSEVSLYSCKFVNSHVPTRNIGEKVSIIRTLKMQLQIFQSFALDQIQVITPRQNARSETPH